VTHDDALLYVAESDLDAVFIVDARTHRTVGQVQVGRQPEKVLIAPDDTIYVTNRLGRSVSVLRRGDTTELARLPVAVEPVGLAVSSDSRTLYVVNATSLNDAEYGTVMAFDTATRSMRWEMPVGPEPRGIALLGDGRAAVTLYKAGDVVLLDAATGQVVKAGTDVYGQLNRVALGLDAPGGAPMPRPDLASGLVHPRGLEALTVSPDGTRLYAAGLLASQRVLNVSTSSTSPDASGAGYASGTCGSTAVASPGLLTFDGQGHALVDDLLTCATDGAEHPRTALVSGLPGLALQQPKAMTADSTGSFLFLADFASNNVAIVPTSSAASGGPTGGPPRPDGTFPAMLQVVPVGEGPSGVALSRDGTRAWVHTALDHSVSRLEGKRGQVASVATLRLSDDVLPADVVAGRKLFFTASDARMNDPAMGISCGTCHLEGREDGHVWNFSDGPRQTPSLAGRMLSRTAPFHWSGEFNTLNGFMTQTVQARMGGTGVTPQMEAQLAAFLDAQPSADNPHRGSRSDAVVRGEQVFARADCGSCHGGEAFTVNNFADVGTLVTQGPVVDLVAALPHGGLNTPSLLGVARTAPYLHDGSATSLKARLLQNKAANLHGQTAALTDGDVDDLVAYLNTL
jgi:YVTN family beta-propeller protein